MNEEDQNINETTTRSGNSLHKTTQVSNPRSNYDHKQNLAARLVWYIAGILLVLLGFRFVLVLFGANAYNGFANFIYNTSHPFVSPFFSLFNYRNYVYGVSHFEIYTLVAIVFYSLIAWGLARLFTLNRD